MLKKLAAVALTVGLMSPVLVMAQESKQQEAREEKREGNERHPHIRAAIRELEQSKHELQTAAHDFGGHRKEAIEAIDQAIRQLEEALKYDKK